MTASLGRGFQVVIKGWITKYQEGKLIAGAPRLRVTAEQQELARLRQELQRTKMERDILKKAAAYFARESK